MCHRCQKKGHYATECEEPAPVPRNLTTSTPPTTETTSTQSATTLLMDGVHEGEFEENVHFQFLNQGGVSLKIGPDGRLPHTWILLDNQSTVDVFQNAELLRNIRVHTSKMDIHCNAGIISTQLIGDLHGYGTVWYNPKGIANILSLACVKEHGYRVTFDSSQGNAFHVHKPDGTYIPDLNLFTT